MFAIPAGICAIVRGEGVKNILERLENLAMTTESYLKTESSKTYDGEKFRNHLKGEVSGYRIAIQLIQKEMAVK
jgi:hypothetical protein